MRVLMGLAAVAACAASATGAAANTDAACDVPQARAAMTAYTRAFNQGRFDTLQSLIAREPSFQWYSVAPPHGRVGQRSQNRSTLLAYFRARHASHETQRVVTFVFTGVQERDGAMIANVNGALARKAADLPLERRGFKAAIRCGGSSQFVVVSIGARV